MSARSLLLGVESFEFLSQLDEFLHTIDDGNDRLEITIKKECSMSSAVREMICDKHLTDVNKSVVVFDESIGMETIYRKRDR